MKKVFSLAAMTFFMIGFYACQNKVESGPSFIFKKAPSKEAVAKVNGKTITEAEVFNDIRGDIYQKRMEEYQLKMGKLKSYLLESYINSDPNKKDLTNDQFVETERDINHDQKLQFQTLTDDVHVTILMNDYYKGVRL